MPTLDWERFLEQHSIEFFSSGPSTAKGNIYTKCPWCGEADQGHHLGISIRSPWKGYGCWKNSNHRGRDPARLVSALMNISMERARGLVGGEAPPLLGDEAVAGQLGKLFGARVETEQEKEQPLLLPPEFKPITLKDRSCRMFTDYLLERGYERYHLKSLCRTYELHYAMTGLFKYRVIFPVYTDRGLVTWTGRSIVPEREPRYLTTPVDPAVAGRGPVAKASIKDCLFLERELLRDRGRALLVGEGPFDGMRLDYIGRDYGVRATSLFGKTVSAAQIVTLERIGPRYKRKIFLLDPDARMDNFAMWNKLSGIGFEAGRIRGKHEDPGSTPLNVIERFIREDVLA